MNLLQTIDKINTICAAGIHAGGPGSGCNGPNCGRPKGSGSGSLDREGRRYERSVERHGGSPSRHVEREAGKLSKTSDNAATVAHVTMSKILDIGDKIVEKNYGKDDNALFRLRRSTDSQATKFEKISSKYERLMEEFNNLERSSEGTQSDARKLATLQKKGNALRQQFKTTANSLSHPKAKAIAREAYKKLPKF